MATEPSITSIYEPDVERVRAWLKEMIAAMRFVELVVAIVAFIARIRAVNTELMKQVAQMRRKRPRSESLERLQRQLVLPMGGLVATKTAAQEQADAEDNKEKKSRVGRHPGRAAFPAYLPRVDVYNLVPAAERVCPQCGREMTTVSHSTCETLTMIPARIVVERRHDETVACPADDTIVSASAPARIVEKGKLADTFIVEALCDKYIEHQPVERQCTRFARAGVEVAPQTLGCNVGAAIDLLRPVADLIADKTREPGLLGTDATGIPVLDPGALEGIRTVDLRPCMQRFDLPKLLQQRSFERQRHDPGPSRRHWARDALSRVVTRLARRAPESSLTGYAVRRRLTSIRGHGRCTSASKRP
jgi:transposase